MKIGYIMQAGVPDIRSNPHSGPAIHVKHVVEELRKTGHQVRLLAAFDRGLWKSDNLLDFSPVMVPSMDRGLLRFLERGVRRIQHELRLPYAALFESLRFALACTQELRGYDLLYERMGWFGYGGGLAARWLRIPSILEVNGDPLTEMEMQGMRLAGAQRRISMALMKRAARWASHTVATGEGWREQHIHRWSVDPRKVTAIENGTELVDLLSRNQLRAFQLRSDPGGVMTIAYSGGFDPWQGVTVLIRAVAHAVANGLPVRLLLIGSGAGLQEAQQLVNHLGLDGHATFTGRLSPRAYATCLAGADIGVSAYCGREEYSGLKLLDYKAAGLAVIASGKGGQPKVIEHGRTGWIVPPCDEDALSHAIERFSADRELVTNLGRTSRIEAEHLHSWKNTVQQLDALFNEVIWEHQATRRNHSWQRL